MLIKEDNLLPTRRARGRIIDIHPGTDNLRSTDCDPAGQGPENHEKTHSKTMPPTNLAHRRKLSRY